MKNLLIAFISFGITLIVLSFLTKGRLLQFALDEPNERSLHQTPVPRTGGIAILSGTMAGWYVLGAPDWPIWLALVILLVVSFLDDLHNLPVLARFGTHFIASGLFAYFVLLPSIGPIGTSILVLIMVWMINLYNFMDGSDGLAGGMAFFGFGFYSIASWMANDKSFALLNMAIAMSAVAFLVFNFHPAKIFMGDAGAIPLGFLAASLGLLGWKNGNWPLWFPLAIFSPFIVDTTATLLKRFFKGEKVWQAHKGHYYQRLIRMGLGHRNLALLEYALMAAIGLASLAAMRHPAPLLAFLGITFALVMRHIDRRWTEYDK